MVINVTVTAPTKAGYITVWPAGAVKPTASNLNFAAGQTIPNLVIVPLGVGGKISLFNGSAGTAQLIGDIAGYYLGGVPATAGAFVSLSPTRVLDTRHGVGAAGPVAALGTAGVQIAGIGGVPATAVSAVVINVTVTAPTKAGYITVWPAGAVKPTASNLNFAAGQTIPNLVIVPLGAGGKISLFNGSAGTAQLIGDIAGYYLGGVPATAGAFVSLSPTRVLDTRHGVGAAGPVAALGTAGVQIAGIGGVPATAVSAVVINVTVTAPTKAGYITVWPAGAVKPTASNLNFAAGQTIPNLVIVPLGAGGKISLFNGSAGTAQLIGDIAGYYSAVTDTTAPGGVTHLAGTTSISTVQLTWTNPSDQDFAGVIIRRTVGATAPANISSGTSVASTTGAVTSFTDTGLASATTYSYAVFTRDFAGNYSAGASLTVTTASVYAPCGAPITKNSEIVSRPQPYMVDCTIDVPPGVTLLIDAGTVLKFAPGITGIHVENRATLRIAGTAAAPTNMVSMCDDAVGGVSSTGRACTSRGLPWSVVLDAGNLLASHTNFERMALSDCDSGCSETQFATASISASTFDDGDVTLRGGVVFSGNSFSATAALIEGGSPVVQGNAWVSTTQPLEFYAVRDLSGVFNNKFAGDDTQRVVKFGSSEVTHNWTIDGGSSNQIALFADMTVDSGTTTAAAGAVMLTAPVGLNVAAGGTFTAAGTAASPASLSTVCGSKADLGLFKGGYCGGDPTSTENGTVTAANSTVANTPGGVFNLDHTIVTGINMSPPGSQGAVPTYTAHPTVSITNSTLHTGVILFSQLDGFHATSNTATNYSIEADAGRDSAPIVVSGNSFSATAALIEGGSPVVQGNAWVSTTQPLEFYAVRDLSGVFNNKFAGDDTQRVVKFGSSEVTHNWTIDGGSSNQIALFADMTVDSGTTTAAAGAVMLTAPVGLNVAAGGTFTAAGTAASPASLSTVCGSKADLGLFKGGYCGGDPTSTENGTVTAANSTVANTPGGVFNLDHTIVTGINMSPPGSQGAVPTYTAHPTVSITNSTLHTGVILFSQLDGFHATSNTATNYSIEADAGRDSAPIVVSGNSFSATAALIEGGSPVVQGNAWVSTTQPLEFYAVRDLSGVFNNKFAGDDTQRVVKFGSSEVTHNWTIDGGSSNQIALFADMTVDSGTTTAAAGAVMLASPGGLHAAAGGTFTAAGTAASPTSLSTVCGSKVDVGLFKGEYCGGDPTSTENGTVTAANSIVANTPGGVLNLDHTIITGIDMSPPAFQGTVPTYTAHPTVSITNSTLHTGSISFSQLDGFHATSNTATNYSTEADNVPAPVVSKNVWTATPNPFTSYGDADLSGVADDNTAGGPDGVSDQIFNLSGSVPKDKTFKLAPSSKVVYYLGDISVAKGGTFNAEAGAQIFGSFIEVSGTFESDSASFTSQPGATGWNGVTVESGGSATAKKSSFALAANGFDVENKGTLKTTSSTFSLGGAGIQAHAGSTVTVSGGTFSTLGVGVVANPECSEDTKWAVVGISGATFDANSFNVSNCNFESSPLGTKVTATGNSGLAETNVSTHHDTCVWTYPDEAPPPNGRVTYDRYPMWDVNIGASDAPPCLPGYLNE